MRAVKPMSRLRANQNYQQTPIAVGRMEMRFSTVAEVMGGGAHFEKMVRVDHVSLLTYEW